MTAINLINMLGMKLWAALSQRIISMRSHEQQQTGTMVHLPPSPGSTLCPQATKQPLWVVAAVPGIKPPVMCDNNEEKYNIWLLYFKQPLTIRSATVLGFKTEIMHWMMWMPQKKQVWRFYRACFRS